MLEISSLKTLENKKNLLAFSAGVDSTALFFLLLNDSIKFDIAIVNYGQRNQAVEEVAYAKELASTYNLKCHTFIAKKIDKNFESTARNIRYNFFEELITTYNYDNLLTAHHLGDRFEWMLMQFCKGAGCAELAGMREKEQREFYTLIRPLLRLDKQELYSYLKANNIKYFEDNSNLDEDITRNSFRHNHASPLLDKYLDGIKKSFAYLDEDKAMLTPEVIIKNIDEFSYFAKQKTKRADIFTIDKLLKSKKYMLSFKERELLKNKNTLIVGRKFIVNINEYFIFIVPYLDANLKMNHKFKEECRVLKIEPKLRPFLYANEIVFEKVKELF
ncbi:tRNA lysidine(34) synthetase TilS [Sulfurimonas sp.]|uniref:tRNA lysidine(34) synthetase TilS n=1 Tax=Sulfurimonas sp. TaxID=2022749 RepID=UPI002B48FB75|nr:tRNA lysidine(34) synthetase TilS [Sulfurimonas sp.]